MFVAGILLAAGRLVFDLVGGRQRSITVQCGAATYAIRLQCCIIVICWLLCPRLNVAPRREFFGRHRRWSGCCPGLTDPPFCHHLHFWLAAHLI